MNKELIKSNLLFKWITILSAYIFFLFFHILFFPFKINNRKIVVCNFYGNGYGDNPKYIVEELLKMKKSLDIVWLVSNKREYKFPKGIRTVKIFSIRSIYEFMTAKIWIDNCRKYFFYNLFKKKDTVYIQTWHGGIGLKRAEQEVENHLSKSYICSAKHDSKMIDYFLSGSKWLSDDIKVNFWYDGKIEETGLPRNDKLINESKVLKEKVYNFYKLNNDMKIVLYAPTFRQGNTKADFMDFAKLKSALNEKFNKEWIIFLRLHPNIKELKVDLPEYVINASFYEDAQELLCAADILITDYSSIMFDMMLLDKPVFVYANDLKKYTSNRGLKFDLKKLPFSYAENDFKLIKNIEQFDEKNFKKDLERFKEKLVLHENGTASVKVAFKILKIMNTNSKNI
ncbi:CDP-glycerol glycerophosphotransferase family protein [Phascolarctobacterium faecium]|uniref:CDP-glycerol glycerophosphotransferase family protein n=1 Tax=Phascolarctobacterium faecium TaxID=33025 RepID=UPI003A8514F1